MNKLLSVSEAQKKLLEVFSPLEPMEVHLTQSVGRVLARRIRSNIDLPRFSNSSMDGFAVKYSDVVSAGVDHPVTLSVIGDIPAGQSSQMRLDHNQAMRIMTGAPIPIGADTVVPVEFTDFHEHKAGAKPPEYVQVCRSVKKGDYIRYRGEDVRVGEEVYKPGIRIRPQDIGFLAMLGVANIFVFRLPKVAVLSTGDELLPIGTSLIPGKIYDSNTYTLIALIDKYGGESKNLGIVPDQYDAVQAGLDQAVDDDVDLIISSAGVSVGAFDFVRSVVEKEGHLGFWRVNMRPGKPIAFGEYKGVPFVGLPGNPVSAFIGFEIFIRPALGRMSGTDNSEPSIKKVRLLESIKSDGRESYLRAIIERKDNHRVARLTGHQGSGNLRSLVQANALLIIPSGVKSLPVNSEVNALMLDEV